MAARTRPACTVPSDSDRPCRRLKVARRTSTNPNELAEAAVVTKFLCCSMLVFLAGASFGLWLQRVRRSQRTRRE